MKIFTFKLPLANNMCTDSDDETQSEAGVINTEVDSVYLAFDDRKRGRLKIQMNSGEVAGIQIERGDVMRDGTILTNDENDHLKILAADEKVSTAYVADATLFARGCYHLGNRHVPLQIGDGFLRYQEDYVLDEMLQGLGIEITHEQAPFEPENGAYANGSGHHHAGNSVESDRHSHGHSHHHAH